MFISDNYLAEQVRLHERGGYGIHGERWLTHIADTAIMVGAKSILDYGCGAGGLGRYIRALGGEIQEYDPAIEGKNNRPEPADLVVCTDVLEHIEPHLLDDVIEDLWWLTDIALFVSISTRPAGKTLSDGHNAHLIIEGANWWRPTLEKRFRVKRAWPSQEQEWIAMLKPREATIGYGDEIVASGMARGAAARGKRIAFGDGRKIIWGPHCAAIFKGNPNVAAPGSEGDKDIEWIGYYKGKRNYNRPGGRGWLWNYDFRPAPGEIFFDVEEQKRAESVKPGFVLIEPNVPVQKGIAPNKQWPVSRYQEVANRLMASGYRVLQCDYNGANHRLNGVERIMTASFRDALAVLSRAALYLGPEGGMHHGAAALGIKGVVIFGGVIPPAVTGYDFHANLAAGGEACGSTSRCEHCRLAMDAITVDQVYQAAMEMLAQNKSEAA